MKPPLRFHWSLFPGETDGDAAAFAGLCLQAEENGVESVDVPGPGSLADTIAFATAAVTATAKIRLRIVCDASAISPGRSAQQVEKAGAILGNRLIVHLKLRGMADADLALASEFCANCREMFKYSEAPEIHLEGDTAEAAFLAIKQGDCLWRHPDRPDQVYADALPVLHFGKEVGLVSSVIARATRAAALEAAVRLLPEFAEHWEDPACWLTSHLWTRAVPGCGAKSVIMVGSFEELAQAVHRFKKNGISQFLFRGCRDERELMYFGAGLLPLVRALENGRGPVE